MIKNRRSLAFGVSKMRIRISLIAAAAAVWGLVSSAIAQDPGMAARDMFYSAADLLGKKPGAKPTIAQKPKPPDNSPAKGLPAGPQAARPTETQPGATQPSPGSGVKVTAALGLRYSILKRNAAGEYIEVRPDTIFHAGDQIRLSVTSNERGHLYIVQQGSSGTWSPLFPDAQIKGSELNLIEAYKKYEIPGGPGERFVLDEHAGEERIFMLLTRQTEASLDKIVAMLRQRRSANTTSIDNSLISQLRDQVQPRDLVFSSVDDGDNEKAVYVVNQAASKPESHVVVDLKLIHQ
jgi:hypothetical protein